MEYKKIDLSLTMMKKNRNDGLSVRIPLVRAPYVNFYES